jgi:hypothetical protein
MGMEQSVLSAIQAGPQNAAVTSIATSASFQADAQHSMQTGSLERGATPDTLAVKRNNETLISSGLANFVNNARSQQSRGGIA